MGGALSLDIAMMTLVFAASGGAMNPFTVFYRAHHAGGGRARCEMDDRPRGAVDGRVRAPVRDPESPARARTRHGHELPGHEPPAGHVGSVRARSRADCVLRRSHHTRVASQRDQIATLRETAARNARLAALTTLAAGAAHELNNPLATIAVAAHEAKLRAEKLASGAPVTEDLRLILLEVDRRQDILHQMASRAELGDEPQRTTFEELAGKIRAQLGDARTDCADLRLAATSPKLRVPVEQMAQSVVALIKNAIDASPPTDCVVVTLAHDAADVTVSISKDIRGSGIPDDVLAKVGEPFFTTSSPVAASASACSSRARSSRVAAAAS